MEYFGYFFLLVSCDYIFFDYNAIIGDAFGKKLIKSFY